MMKLNEEAIDELMTLLNKVKDVQKLLKEWGIYIDSDCWNATSINRDKEDILNWEREDFEKLELNGSGDKFFIGGNIVTGSEHQYNNKWILAPKKLAEIQGEIFTDYLMDIMDSVSLKHFELEFDDEFGLIDNCGWEHHICIDAIVKKSALKDSIVEEIVENIKKDYQEFDMLLDEQGRIVGVDTPKHRYFIEIQSDLVDHENGTFCNFFGINEKGAEQILKESKRMHQIGEDIQNTYGDAVKVMYGKWNESLEFGMGVWVFIL